MTDTLNTNEQSGKPGNPSNTGSVPRILVNGSARESTTASNPAITGSQPPVGAQVSTTSTPAPPADIPPTELFAAPGAVKSSMPDWAQNAVTGNIRETSQGQARRKAARTGRTSHANHASDTAQESSSYPPPSISQQDFSGYSPYDSPRPSVTQQPQAPRKKGITVSPGVIIAICAVIIVLVVALVVVTLSALNNSSQSAPQTNTPVEEVDHRWDNLSWENDRAYFSENGQITSQTGIDVSDHQGWIDWNAVSNDDIDFAYIRLGNRGYTEGAIFQDQYYEYNIDSAHEAGLDVGVYFFSQAINEEEAREEAEFVLEKLNGRTLELPIAWDHEVVEDPSGRANNLDRETLTKCAQAFFEVIEAAGYDTILYGNTHDLDRIDLEALDNEPVWLAEYGVEKPTPKLDLIMWQYTNSATVSGVDGAVDLDIRFKNVVK